MNILKSKNFDLFSKSKRTVERDEPCGDAWREKYAVSRVLTVLERKV